MFIGRNPIRRARRIHHPKMKGVFQTIFAISSKLRRGDRGFNTDGSPYPRLHRKFDLMLLPAKDAARLRHGRSHWFHIEEKNPAEATGLY
jgi:hypothetical protein